MVTLGQIQEQIKKCKLFVEKKGAFQILSSLGYIHRKARRSANDQFFKTRY